MGCNRSCYHSNPIEFSRARQDLSSHAQWRQWEDSGYSGTGVYPGSIRDSELKR